MSGSDETRLRRDLVAIARSLHDRGYTHGTTGNLSARAPGDRVLVSPTGAGLDELAVDNLSVVALDGTHLDGPAPTKESFLHVAMLRARPHDTAVVHTHSPYAAALSCLDGVPEDDALPRLTAYLAMRVQSLPLLPYHPPGDTTLGALAEATARQTNAILLRNHGPVVSGRSLRAAADAIEEIEQTARIFFIVGDRPVHLVPR